MTNGKTIADVLRAVIDVIPSWANALVVVFGLLGVASCGLSGIRLYQAVERGEGSPLNWLVAFTLGAGMTIVAVIVGQSSFLFSPAE